MNRQLTKREEVLLVILIVFAIFVAYIKLYMEPLNNKIAALESKTADEMIVVEASKTTAAQQKMMEQEIEEAKGSEYYKIMPQYDNSRAVMKELYAILENTEDYLLNFGDTVRSDYIVARPVSLQFQTRTYEDARAIIDRISDSELVVELGDVCIQAVTGKAIRNEIIYKTQISITYFEADY